MRIKLTAINGVAVTKSNVSGRVKTASFVPKVRSIVEDYTGTWCGYCPRGFVAMESMARDYPGQILGVAYHYDDPMDLSTFSEPTSVSGYPSLYQNRDYVANANNAAELSLKASNGLAAAAVNMESAEWLDEEFSQAKGTATVEFGEDVTNGQYMVEFILIEDGVGGTSSGWMQCDYYYGGSAGDWDDPLWNQFLNNPDNVFVYEHNGYTYYYIRNLTFNDVCIANTRVSKSGFTSSIPATAARTPITFEYTFDGVNSIVENVSDSSREILMTPEKCKIAVVVTEKSSGAFVNCDWLTIGGEQSGVKTVQADDSNVNAEKEYFNLSGMKIAADNLTPGIYIVRQGNKTSKVVIR
jgi:thiol-disulfide isomerase/thioredoxin